MQIIENVLPEQFFKSLKDQIFDNEFSWYFGKTSNDISGESIYGCSFSHLAYKDGVSNSCVSYDCRTALIVALSKLDINLTYLSRIRLGLLYPTPVKNYVNVPHIDNTEPHYVGIFYLNDTDADTLIYNEKYNNRSGMSPEEYYNKVLDRKVSVFEKIKCKENSFVMFEGNHYHSSVCPSDVSRRIVINYNFNI